MRVRVRVRIRGGAGERKGVRALIKGGNDAQSSFSDSKFMSVKIPPSGLE